MFAPVCASHVMELVTKPRLFASLFLEKVALGPQNVPHFDFQSHSSVAHQRLEESGKFSCQPWPSRTAGFGFMIGQSSQRKHLSRGFPRISG